jgi:hypothetical protein
VKGQEPTISQGLGEFRGDLVVKDEGEEFGECAQALGVAGLVRGGEAEGLDGVSVVAKGSVGGARLELGKGFEDNLGGNGEARGVANGLASTGPGSVVDARGVKVFAQGFNMVSHLGNGERGLDALVASAVVVIVEEGLGLGARIVIRGKLSSTVVLRGAGNRAHAVIKGADSALAKEGEASQEGVFIALWL